MEGSAKPKISLLLVLLLSMCTRLEVVDPENPPAVQIGLIDKENKTISAKVTGTGDGVVRFGFVVSSSNNPLIDSENSLVYNIENNALLTKSQEYSHTLPIDDFTEFDIVYFKAFVEDSYGRIHYSVNIRSLSLVKAKFGYTPDPSDCYAPCKLSFKDSSNNTGDNATYFWDFGDGDEDNSWEQNPSYKFVNPGKYEVTLTVTAEGLTNTVKDTIEIPGITFVNTFTRNYASGKKVIALDNNGYAITGQVNSKEIYLLKTDEFGSVESSFNDIHSFSTSTQVNDFVKLGNQFIVVGSKTNEQDNLSDIFLYVINTSSGQLESSLFFDDIDVEEIANSVITHEGKFILVGSRKETNKNIFIIILNRNLGVLFKKELELSFEAIGNDVCNYSSGYAIAGVAIDGVHSKALFLKTDFSGNLIEPHSLLNESGFHGYQSIYSNSSDNFYMCGFSYSLDNPGEKILLIKADQSTIIDNYSIERNLSERANDLIVLSDGSIVIVGNKNRNAYIAKLDNSGNVLWERDKWGINDQELSGFDSFNSIAQTSDGGFVMVGGVSNGDLLLVKVDDNGEL